MLKNVEVEYFMMKQKEGFSTITSFL